MENRISVIIPVKNRADLLKITLENLLQQSRKPFEILVIDDHSTDHIGDVEKEYSSSVVKFLKSFGNGPGAARNTGFKASTGDYIQFFDSDDIMTRNKLQVQAELLERNNADFVYGPNVKAIYKNGNWEQVDLIMQYYPVAGGALADRVLEQWCSITQSVLFSRLFLEKVGEWNEDLLTHEDYEYWFRIGKTTRHFIHENESCVIYRQHTHQITDMQVNVKDRWTNELTAMRKIENELAGYRPSLHSFLLFKGRYAYSTLLYKHKYEKRSRLSLGLLSYLNIFYFKISNKLGRIQTGTAWQKMHGVLSPGNKEFENYIALV